MLCDPDGDDPATGQHCAGDLVRIEDYPLHDRDGAAYAEVVARARAGLASGSCALLRGFIAGRALEAMRVEAVALAPGAVYMEREYNPYFGAVPGDVPASHPRRRTHRRSNGMVRGDRFRRDGAIWSLFKNETMRAFVSDCLEIDPLFTYRDPFGCMNVNVQAPGSEFARHFDNNDFTVSVVLDKPEHGGLFEYVPGLRTADDERYDEVQAVLDGDRRRVKALALEPGDLQLFKGRYALHRVTAPSGARSRLSLLLGYVPDREKMAPTTYSEMLWGAVHPLQVAAERRASGEHRHATGSGQRHE